MQVLSSLSGLTIYAPSAGFAPTNSADVSAIASAYQVVSATATQLNAGTAYLTSVNETPISASRAGNAANASLATSAYYDGTGRLISALPDEATVSSIASAYAESAASSKLDESATADFYPTSNPSAFVDSAYVDSAVSGKQDSLTFAYNEDSAISSINGSALAGQDGEVVTATATRIWENGGITATALSSVNDTPIASQYLLTDTKWASEPSVAGRSYHQMNVNPLESPFTATSDIYSPLRYATGAVLTYLSMASNDTTSGALGGRQTFGGFFKGNEIYISNGQSSVQQCLRMETHASRGVNVFGTDAFHSSYFKLSTAGVGISSTAGTATFDLEHYNSWNGKLDTSAIECDTASAITAIGGSAIAGGGGGVDSATVSAIASSYAESATSGKQDSSAMTAYVEKTAYDNLYSAFTALSDVISTYSGWFSELSSISSKVDNSAIGVIE